MSDSSDSKSAVDQNFITALRLMNSLGITYWACHGTLLGLIRESALIPSDHDIDFAVWKASADPQQIIKLFEANGFSLTEEDTEASLHFDRPGGRKVDVNFYEPARDPQLACVLWRVPRQTLLARILIGLVENNEVQSRLHAALKRFPLSRLLARPIYSYCNKRGTLHYYRGYTNPLRYLQDFTFINVCNIRCMVPKNAEQILQFMYGSSWRTPINNYDWTKDSPAVVSEDKPLT